MLDLFFHVAAGWDYRGHRVNQGAVVYVALEGQEGYAKRLEALRQHYVKRLDLDGKHDLPFYLIRTQIDLIADHNILISDIRSQLDPVSPAVVVLDTVNRSLNGSESSDEDMSRYLRAAETVRAAFGGVVCLVHHFGVDETRPRGHTSQSGAQTFSSELIATTWPSR
jgi:RecA-family ATPase